jgi:hypothetical protein
MNHNSYVKEWEIGALGVLGAEAKVLDPHSFHPIRIQHFRLNTDPDPGL